MIIKVSVGQVSASDTSMSIDMSENLAAMFALLADPVRLRLVSIVASRNEVCSCDLTEALGKSQPTISHHTKVLSDAGLIVGEKRGRWMWWRLNGDRSAEFVDAARTLLRCC
jgi:ArsR family transcriptional regulator, arsenate/arsenite/antimonite-responsive transcriptional repressor